MWQQAVVVGNPTGLVTDGGAVGLDIIVVSVHPDQAHAHPVAILIVTQNAVFIPMQAVPGDGCQRTGGDGFGLAHTVGNISKTSGCSISRCIEYFIAENQKRQLIELIYRPLSAIFRKQLF